MVEKILITGSNGFLAQHIVCFLQQFIEKPSIYGFVRNINKNTYLTNDVVFTVDCTQPKSVTAFVNTIKPTVIIHAAAMSKPDDCIQQPTACIENNVLATQYLIDAAKQVNAYFVYISTDFVFGDDGPHAENAIKAPLNFYGLSKLMAEQLVMQSSLAYSVVRPVFIYGPALMGTKPSFLHWVATHLQANKPLKVVNDQHRTPTYVTDICYAIAKLIKAKQIGDFNIAGDEYITPFALAIKVARHLQLDETLIEPVTAESFNEPVKRAKNGGLMIKKAEDILGFKPTSIEVGISKTFMENKLPGMSDER